MIEMLTYHKNVPAGNVDPRNIIPPAGASYTIVSMSFTGPYSGDAAAILYWDGDIIDAGQGDKFVGPVKKNIIGDGVKVLTMELNNSAGGGTSFLGIVVCYEQN